MTPYAAFFLGFVLGLICARIPLPRRDVDMTTLDLFRRLKNRKASR